MLLLFGAALFAGQQVREARKSREAQMAAEFFRRWDALLRSRRSSIPNDRLLVAGP